MNPRSACSTYRGRPSDEKRVQDDSPEKELLRVVDRKINFTNSKTLIDGCRDRLCHVLPFDLSECKEQVKN